MCPVKGSAGQVAKANKVFIAGEYDWTDKWSRLPLLLGIVPVLFALFAFCLPRRWSGKKYRIPFLKRKGVKPTQETPQTSNSPLLDSKATVAPESGSKEESASLKNSSLYPPEPILLSHTAPQSDAHYHYTFRRWHLALLFLLLIPVIEGIVLALRPRQVLRFTPLLARNGS